MLRMFIFYFEYFQSYKKNFAIILIYPFLILEPPFSEYIVLLNSVTSAIVESNFFLVNINIKTNVKFTPQKRKKVLSRCELSRFSTFAFDFRVFQLHNAKNLCLSYKIIHTKFLNVF